MLIDFFGGNCIKIKTKLVSIVFDDNMKALNGKGVVGSEDVACITNTSLIPVPDGSKLSFFMPGSYEVGDAMITGIEARAHMDEDGQHNATIYKVITADLKLLILGHIYPELSDEQLELIGLVDILFIPVGGHGYTLDAVGAANIARKISAKVIIPTHYAQKGIKYEVPQDDYDAFTNALATSVDKISRPLKIKKSDITDNIVIKVLEDAA